MGRGRRGGIDHVSPMTSDRPAAPVEPICQRPPAPARRGRPDRVQGRNVPRALLSGSHADVDMFAEAVLPGRGESERLAQQMSHVLSQM